MSRKYDYLLFDADDTLFDFGAASHQAIGEVFAQYGIPQQETFLALYHAVNAALWLRGDLGELKQEGITLGRFRHTLAVLGREDVDYRAMNEDYKAALAQQSVLFQGAQELIEELHEEGYTLAIVTNGLKQVQRGRFKDCPITPYFQEIFISEELGVRKPQTEFFDLVCAGLGNPDRERTVIIGDSLQSDILGGNLAKIDTIWYNKKLSQQQKNIAPTCQVRDYHELRRALKGESIQHG